MRQNAVAAGIHGDTVVKRVNEGKMAPRRRLERPTCPLGGGCSIQLSYRGAAGADSNRLFRRWVCAAHSACHCSGSRFSLTCPPAKLPRGIPVPSHASILLCCSLLCAAILHPTATHASDKQSYGNVTVSEVTSIYDADTFRVDIRQWPAVVGSRIAVRVKGIDAPEMQGKCEREKELARKAKQTTVAMLRAGKKIELRNLQRDKYFRLLADVYVDGKSLAATLQQAGLVYPYNGGTKKSWCNVTQPR